MHIPVLSVWICILYDTEQLVQITGVHWYCSLSFSSVCMEYRHVLWLLVMRRKSETPYKDNKEELSL